MLIHGNFDAKTPFSFRNSPFTVILSKCIVILKLPKVAQLSTVSTIPSPSTASTCLWKTRAAHYEKVEHTSQRPWKYQSAPASQSCRVQPTDAELGNLFHLFNVQWHDSMEAHEASFLRVCMCHKELQLLVWFHLKSLLWYLWRTQIFGFLAGLPGMNRIWTQLTFSV